MEIRSIIICFILVGLTPAQTETPSRPSSELLILNVKVTGPPQTAKPQQKQDEIAGPPRRVNPQADPVDKLRTPPAFPAGPSPTLVDQSHMYVYSLEVKNMGEKKIRGVLWEYIAVDRASGAELNRRRFISIKGISPSKVATLSVRYPVPPTNIVTAEGLGKDERSPFTSSAEIRCVLYADGTASKSDDECSELREADAQRRGLRGKQP